MRNEPQSQEDVRKKHDAGSGNESSDEMQQMEGLIDPGNEHSHAEDSKIIEGRGVSKHEADPGSKATGSTEAGPGEGENDKSETSGEMG